jgi:hypothetical protein
VTTTYLYKGPENPVFGYSKFLLFLFFPLIFILTDSFAPSSEKWQIEILLFASYIISLVRAEKGDIKMMVLKSSLF